MIINEKPEFTSNKSLFVIIVLLFGGFGFGSLGFFLVKEAFRNTYPEIWTVAFGAFFGLTGLYSLVALFLIDNIEIYNNRLELKSIVGKTKKIIYYEEIITWSEIEKENKHQKWKDLTIYTSESSYKISSSIYTNYSDIRQKLIRGKARDRKFEQSWNKSNNRYWAIGMFLFGALCFWGSFYFYTNKDNRLDYSSLTSLSGTIISPVKVSSGSKTNKYIRINIKEYPEFNFDINGVAYAVTDVNSLINNVKKGDKIYVSILTKEYQSKLTKQKELSFWDKVNDYKFIQVYGIEDSSYTYLSTYDYNMESKTDNKIGIWTLSLLGVFLCGLGFYQLQVKK